MKPGYKKKATSSSKKLAKQKRKESKKPETLSVPNDDVPAAMDVDDVVTKPASRREKKKQEVLAVKNQKLKTDILKKTTIKGRKKAARGIQGATSLTLRSVGSKQLQEAQKKQQQLSASLKAVGIDVVMTPA